jgi:multidrug resistance efflux pump
VEAKSWEHEIEIARSAVRQAEEQLKTAQEQMSDTTIKAPINGIVATRHMSVGDYAGSAALPSGKPIFTVIGVDVLKAIWSMPVADVRRIKSGELVLIPRTLTFGTSLAQVISLVRQLTVKTTPCLSTQQS